MKKIIIPLSLLMGTPMMAQEILPETYVQLSGEQLNGSARFQALGGSMGSLGADLSAMSINPAGGAMFNYNHFSISGNLTSSNAENTLNGNMTKDGKTSFNMPNVGFVNVIDNNKSNGITKTTWGLSYQNIQNYNTRTYAKGLNSESGIEYFLDQANNGFNGGAIPHDNVNLRPGETLDYLYDFFNSQPNGFASQQALLGYQGYLINKVNGGGYSSNLQPGSSLEQTNKVTTKGYHGKVSFNLATEINKKFYLGANLNLHSFKNERMSSFLERNLSSVTSGVKAFEFNNYMHTYGTGVSLQAGAIAKVTKELRVGVSYQSPIWKEMTDEFQQNLGARYFESGVEKGVEVDPNILTVYEPYRFRTPSSWTASASYIFGKVGLLSVDYQMKDYSKMKFAENSGVFGALNNYFKQEMTTSHDLRIGGEVRLDQWSLRAGYRNITSPYKTVQFIGDMTSYSGGIGYSYGRSRMDLSYTMTQQEYKQSPLSSGMKTLENIKFKNNFINLTYSASF
ncbi:OmpP1/FadL family transporter [Capnocytophaga sp. ARDL2]|uniref:OmpP1/FadL family transporter n=1 Tax=Capnocytophaga sp. ARDL2 TaxID=3238809 RepID=UPI00355684F7